MSLSQEIASHLPYLRRYARALIGSQAGGDAYVVETLEAIIGAPEDFRYDLGVRPGLYRVFTSLCAPMLKAGLAELDGVEETNCSRNFLRNLTTLTARSRQAFLLKAVEEFSREEIAFILNVDQNTISGWLLQADREITESVTTQVLIIEDEPIIAAELSITVRDLGHSVIGFARTQDEALALIEGRNIGLVLADIHLADGSSGIDTVNKIVQNEEVPVIFITAYAERLLTGRRPEPTFLITKPYRIEALKATIFQSLFFDQRASAIAAAVFNRNLDGTVQYSQ